MDPLNTADPPEEEETSPETRERGVARGSANATRNLGRRDDGADAAAPPANPLLRALLLEAEGFSFSANRSDPKVEDDANRVLDDTTDSVDENKNSSKTTSRARRLEPSANSMGDPDGIDALDDSHRNFRTREVSILSNASVQLSKFHHAASPTFSSMHNSLSKCSCSCSCQQTTSLLKRAVTDRTSPRRLIVLILLFSIAYLIIDPLDLKLANNSTRQLSYSQLSSRLTKAQYRLNQTLHLEYGNCTSLFYDTSVIERTFAANGESLDRLKTKMMTKIVQAGIVRERGSNGMVEVGFRWVTAGDGGAAGYGNLFHQAYTQIIEDTAKDSFDMLGISFIANNYAMEGMTSGPELALCMETLYGSNIDILSWDFYETDKEQVELYQLWGNRVGIHPTSPALFLQNNEEQRAKINSQFESVGLCTVGFDAAHLHSLLPDSQESTVNNLPVALRHYKCNGKVEEDSCESHKWDINTCNFGQYQTKSRKGWKEHKLIGRAIGVFLIQMLRDALAELRHVPFNPMTLHNLTLPQIQDRKAFLASSLHETHQGSHVHKNTAFLGGLGRFSPFWKTNAFCHSALLPNQARYDGISTIGSSGVRHGGGYYTGYEVGHCISNLPTPLPHGTDKLMLVFRPESQLNCSSVFHIDYKDFFGVRTEDGWVKAELPNEKEMEKFTNQNRAPAHAIVICESICSPGQCENRVSIGGIASQDVSITINGHQVVSAKNLELYDGPSDCVMLLDEHDSFLWPSKNRQYDIGFKTNEKGMMYLSSVIII